MENKSTRRISRRFSVTQRYARLTEIFKPEDVLHHLEPAPDASIIQQLLAHLALEYGIGNLREAVQEVSQNMEKESPHVRPGLAVLHGRLEKVTEPLVAIATFQNGIEFAGRHTYVVFVILSPIDTPGIHKQILHSVTRTCDNAEAIQKVAALTSPLAVWQHFELGGHRLPDHLQARHIMAPPKVILNSDDSLARAIDLFLEHRALELPVLSSDRELIGVVTTRRLVKVCLPDYLMWVEDMTPFLNFEPIADVIRNESSTWLREIMVQNFAHVVETSPAILALKEIGRRDTDNCYVLRGRELVGIIHLHEFLGTVLR